MTRRRVVLVLRGDDAFSGRLREAGIEAVNLELITTAPVDHLSSLRERLGDIENFDGFFFTSPMAASVFLKQSARQFGGKIYVLGERTKVIFENAGITVEYRADANTADELIAAFGDAEFAGKRLLFVRGDKSMRTIPEMLAGKATVEEVVVYRTVDISPDGAAISDIQKRLSAGEIDLVCFFSPSAVESFGRIFRRVDIKAAAIGRTTARQARDAGIEVDFVSERANALDFADGLIAYIKKIG